jgi:hypothetical protein
VFNAKQRWLILLARYAPRDGRPVHNGVDETYLFREIAGAWPIAERWQGDAIIDPLGILQRQAFCHTAGSAERRQTFETHSYKYR